MRKTTILTLSLLLAAMLLLGAAPNPGSNDQSGDGSAQESAEEHDLNKNLSREEDKSLLPHNSWTDIENTEYWENLFAGIKRSGNWGEDLAHIAFSQIGYHESFLNTRLGDDGIRHGYTRYGGWYGVPHGEWCAMYVSFCLHYAGIPEESVPYEAHCGRWEGALRKRGLYNDARSYLPKRGDLIFFGQRGLPNHVGIVYSFDEETGEIRYIHGNSPDLDVAIDGIDASNGSIVGYGMLPDNPAKAARSDRQDPG